MIVNTQTLLEKFLSSTGVSTDTRKIQAGNLFFAINQILNDLDDNEYICIIDCDIIPFKKYDGILPNDNEVITCNKYED